MNQQITDYPKMDYYTIVNEKIKPTKTTTNAQLQNMYTVNWINIKGTMVNEWRQSQKEHKYISNYIIFLHKEKAVPVENRLVFTRG